MLKLFYAPHTCALASHIALEEAGAGYEAVRVDFKKNAQRAPEYLAVNPKGRVPSLATDLGILTETPAILAFIDPARFPRVLDHRARMAARPSVKKALAEELGGAS